MNVPMCDRCKHLTRAVRQVTCYYGCSHWQCEKCAVVTEGERRDGEAYDRKVAGS